MSRYSVLSEQDIQHFYDKGHIVIRGAFDPKFALEQTEAAWDWLGYDKNDPSTWEQPIIHMSSLPDQSGYKKFKVKDMSPTIWGAICDLLGGEDRIKGGGSLEWSNHFIANFHLKADEPWQAPSAEATGWHKDGDFFRHFLDSPEQGLLTIVMWSDLKHQGGATFAACDSVRPVAEFLAQHPEGVLPGEFDFKGMINECHDFAELTGEPGDIALIHPYLLHASSGNALRVPRFITNPPVALNAPMNFNRENVEDFSPIEQAVLNTLGVERLDFKPTGPRETVVPERIRRREEERARLGLNN